MPKNTVLTIALNRGKSFLARVHVLGPLLAEVQKHAENHVYSKCVQLSFEAGEVGAVKVYFPQAATVNLVRLQVNKALAATDAGTVAVQDSAGNNLATAASLAASTAYGTEATFTPTAHNQIAEDGYITLTTAKTTAGGRVLAHVQYSPWINY